MIVRIAKYHPSTSGCLMSGLSTTLSLPDLLPFLPFLGSLGLLTPLPDAPPLAPAFGPVSL